MSMLYFHLEVSTAIQSTSEVHETFSKKKKLGFIVATKPIVLFLGETINILTWPGTEEEGQEDPYITEGTWGAYA